MMLMRFIVANTNVLTRFFRVKIIGLTVEYQGQLIECYSCHINLPNCDGENQLDNVRYIVERSQSANLKNFDGRFQYRCNKRPTSLPTN